MTFPIGTLWLFRETTTEFGSTEAAIARLVATNLSLLLRQTPQTEIFENSQPHHAIQEIAQWQYESLACWFRTRRGLAC